MNRLLYSAVAGPDCGTDSFADAPKPLDWPQWQGPDRNASPRRPACCRNGRQDGPPLAWKINGLGGGDSAPSIAAGRIFGMSNRGDEEVVWALSESDGKELWVTPLGPAVASSRCRNRKRGRAARPRSTAIGSMSWAWAATWPACRSRTARSFGSAA